MTYASREGNGHQTPSEAYPFQGVAIATWMYGSDGFHKQRLTVVAESRSLNVKYVGQFSPVSNRPIAELVRTGGEILVSPCGNCGQPMSRHRCDFQGASE